MVRLDFIQIKTKLRLLTEGSEQAVSRSEKAKTNFLMLNFTSHNRIFFIFD